MRYHYGFSQSKYHRAWYQQPEPRVNRINGAVVGEVKQLKLIVWGIYVDSVVATWDLDFGLNESYSWEEIGLKLRKQVESTMSTLRHTRGEIPEAEQNDAMTQKLADVLDHLAEAIAAFQSVTLKGAYREEMKFEQVYSMLRGYLLDHDPSVLQDTPGDERCRLFLSRMLSNRCCFHTKEYGLIGIASTHIRKGQIVVALDGCRTEFVFRIVKSKSLHKKEDPALLRTKSLQLVSDASVLITSSERLGLNKTQIPTTPNDLSSFRQSDPEVERAIRVREYMERRLIREANRESVVKRQDINNIVSALRSQLLRIV